MVICLTGFPCKEGVVRETLFHRIFLYYARKFWLKWCAATHESRVLWSQYADDTTFLLDGSEDSFRHSLLTLKLYASFSGLNVNMDKTKVVWIGSMKGSNLRFCEDFIFCWKEKQFTLLGVKFILDLQQMIPINYESKLEEIQKHLSSPKVRTHQIHR